MDDARYMAAALSLARRGFGRTWPNPSVGCLVVRPENGIVVGRGWTQPGGRPHAEPVALADAGDAARGATAYVTLEPCAHYGKTGPCADALIAAGVGRVVSAMEDPDPRVAGLGHERLADAGIDLTVGIGAPVAGRANAGHVTRIRRGRPHVQVKLAVSADGRIGGAGRTPARITGEAANAAVHMMRAEADAIMIGIGTALADDPMLDCRLPGMAERSPVRVIVDTRLRLRPDSRLVRSARTVPLWVLTAEGADSARLEPLVASGAEVIEVPPDTEGRLSLPFALAALAARGITRLMVEGGARLASQLFRGNLVDEAVIFRSPDVTLPDGVPALDDMSLAAVLEQDRYRLIGEERFGKDTARTYWRES